MPEKDPSELAAQHEREADKLEQRGDELQGEIDEVRQDWERKRADEGVPGAAPAAGDAEGEDAERSRGPDAPAGSDAD